ncbi:methyltransferase family protein [Desulfosarcina cetonica]|uniref:methyltransferase family protein n=1 Tax=Desulfosarcina cetonica TaxID=90730 RepID=UPI0006D05277|nr:isoprenylcysteine carboxylmethyltransferase family protein [Desulfosarcina cetonica]
MNKEGVRYLLAPLRWTILMAVAFFLAAGQLNILRAWLAFGIHFLGAIVGAILMWKFAPGLANQRAFIRQGTKRWDKLILAIYFLLVLLAIPILAGLDVGRYQWSQLNINYAIVGIVLYLGFFLLFYWAMLTNEHFEGSSRIQNDRAHRVVMNGPYGLVRHPGYVAMIFACLADSFIIGSLYSLIPAILAVIITIIRTFLEDRMLQNELDGYSEYSRKIKYRLIPGIW